MFVFPSFRYFVVGTVWTHVQVSRVYFANWPYGALYTHNLNDNCNKFIYIITFRNLNSICPLKTSLFYVAGATAIVADCTSKTPKTGINTDNNTHWH